MSFLLRSTHIKHISDGLRPSSLEQQRSRPRQTDMASPRIQGDLSQRAHSPSLASKRPISFPDLREASIITETRHLNGTALDHVANATSSLSQHRASLSVTRETEDNHATGSWSSPTIGACHAGPPRNTHSRLSLPASERCTEVPTKPLSGAYLSRAASLRSNPTSSRRSSLATLHEHNQHPGQAQAKSNPQASHVPAALSAPSKRQTIKRHSSLRHSSTPEVGVQDQIYQVHKVNSLNHAASDSHLRHTDKVRPQSHPSSRSSAPVQYYDHDNNMLDHKGIPPSGLDDPWRLPPLPRSMPSTPRLMVTAPVRAPSLTFKRLSSLDQLITYREDKESWRRESCTCGLQYPTPALSRRGSKDPTPPAICEEVYLQGDIEKIPSSAESDLQLTQDDAVQYPRFRHFAAEVGFCFTIAMTQLLAEYMISGFAVVLPNLFDGDLGDGAGMTGLFWPAALLTLILSAFLLVFARVSDMYGGYGPFMFGLIWLTIWTLVPGFVSSSLMLNVSRAMQGLAIAAYTPSTFSMVGSIYPEGPRRNIVLGLYGACAPLGFYTGFLAGGALPVAESRWYFWIASALAFTTTITAYLSVPRDRTDRKCLNLKMDWLGAFLITSGLILVTYALSVQPYANAGHPEKNGFAFSIVYGPLSCGAVCLFVAFWVEGWYADCPLLPFEFFKPQGVKALCFACLFFYGSFGVWLYNSAE